MKKKGKFQNIKIQRNFILLYTFNIKYKYENKIIDSQQYY